MANQFARDLRRRMTPEETRLWVQLRRWRAKGWHFRRQVPLGGFIVDFACLTRRLVIEVDGLQHRELTHLMRDEARDAALGEMGFRVLRIANAEIKWRGGWWISLPLNPPDMATCAFDLCHRERTGARAYGPHPSFRRAPRLVVRSMRAIGPRSRLARLCGALHGAHPRLFGAPPCPC